MKLVPVFPSNETRGIDTVQGSYVLFDGKTGLPIAYLDGAAFYKALYASGATLTPNERMTAGRRDGNKLVVTPYNEYTHTEHERRVDRVIATNGTLTAADLSFDLQPLSRNSGEVDIDALIAGKPQEIVSNAAATFQLSALATQLPAAVSMQRSMMQSGSARSSDTASNCIAGNSARSSPVSTARNRLTKTRDEFSR